MPFRALRNRFKNGSSRSDTSSNNANSSSPRDSSEVTPAPSSDTTDFSQTSSASSTTNPNSTVMSSSTETMRAIGLVKYGGIENLQSLTLPHPGSPQGYDVLVEVQGSSINPVDTKIRAGTYDDYQTSVSKAQSQPSSSDKDTASKTTSPNPTAYFSSAPSLPTPLGFDTCGIIRAVGPLVQKSQSLSSTFTTGTRVFFSGDPRRPGSNAQYQLADSRNMARTPSSLDSVECASLPLTFITAWESLLERLRIPTNSHSGILIINGAGGVGSMASQIARHVLKLPVVICTAGREETRAFCLEMGATHVVDHRGDVSGQVDELRERGELGDVPVRYVFVTSRTEQYLGVAARVCAPFGKVCSVVQTKDLGRMYGTEWMAKSLTFVWELIGTKVVYGVEDEDDGEVKVESQGKILERLSRLVDDGTIKCHMNHQLPATEQGLRKAHELQESGRVIGKIGIGKDGAGDADSFADSIF